MSGNNWADEDSEEEISLSKDLEIISPPFQPSSLPLEKRAVTPPKTSHRWKNTTPPKSIKKVWVKKTQASAPIPTSNLFDALSS